MSQSSKILIAMILGVASGMLFPEFSSSIAFIGDIFIRLLKVLIIPLIFTSISSGIFNLNSMRTLECLGLKTLLYFSASTICAAAVGIALSVCIVPGNISNPLEGLAQTANSPKSVSIESFISSLFPSNLFQALVEGNLLTIILFSLLFGFALLKLGQESESIKKAINSLNQVVLIFVDWVISLSAIGVFCLISPIVAKTGISLFLPLISFTVTVILGLLILALIVLPAAFMLITQKNIYPYLKKLSYPLMMAFSTASSAATFPVLLKTLQEDCQVSKKTSSFVLSLGITLNMNGTALFQACSVLFFAQFYAVSLSITQYILICLLTLFAAMSAAAIPSAGLVTLTMILSSLQIPVEGIALILGIDRILDMCRTTINIWSNSIACILIDKFSPESST